MRALGGNQAFPGGPCTPAIPPVPAVRPTGAHGAIAKLLEQYDKFLETTGASELDLLKRFSTGKSSRSSLQEASEFGDSVAEALGAISKGSACRFYRLLIV
jgi:hypothetical protein